MINTKPKLMMNTYKPFEIKPQPIITQSRYAMNYFLLNDFDFGMFLRTSLQYKTMNIQLWGAPFNSPNTISTNIFLHFEPLMYEN
jgi:hypothetical protein